MNVGKLITQAQQVQTAASNKVGASKNSLSVETKELMERAKYHHDRVPFTNLSDGLCTFKITYMSFSGNDFIAEGIVWPYKQPAKAAHFLYAASGRYAHCNVSDIMEHCDRNFHQTRAVYKIRKKLDRTLSYPYWTAPIREALVDEEFLVKAHHYKSQLQLDFAPWRFQKDIDKAEIEFRLKATDPELRERNKRLRERGQLID